MGCIRAGCENKPGITLFYKIQDLPIEIDVCTEHYREVISIFDLL